MYINGGYSLSKVILSELIADGVSSSLQSIQTIQSWQYYRHTYSTNHSEYALIKHTIKLIHHSHNFVNDLMPKVIDSALGKFGVKVRL